MSSPTRPSVPVRTIHRRDRDAVATLLTRAFADDPLSRWLYADHEARLRWVHADFRLRLAQHAADGRSVMASDGSGAVIWAAPGYWKGHALGQLRALAAIPRVVRNYERVSAMQAQLDRRHPYEPHLYLALLGVVPEARRRGVASALLAPTLAEADRHRLPAYVEAGTPQAAALYRTLGFEQVGTVDILGAPPMTLMWREPQATHAAGHAVA